jgi:hypothetical protein
VVKIGVCQGLDVPRVQVAEVGKLPITTVVTGQAIGRLGKDISRFHASSTNLGLTNGQRSSTA